MFNAKSIYRSSFLRGILALASSNTLSQVIPFIIIPALTRLYSPEDFGFVASLVAMSAFLSVFASGKFEMALVLSEDKAERERLFSLCLSLLTVFTSILLVITCFTFLFNYLFDLSFHLDQRYLLIPLVVCLLGLSNILYNYINSEKNFKSLAISSIVYSLINNGVALLFYFFSSIGLLLGEIVGRMSMLIYLNASGSNNKLSIKPRCFRLREYKDLLVKYRKFPLYTIPSEVMDVYTKQVPVYMMSFLNLMNSLGFYALTDKVLNKPISIIGKAVSVTFRVRAAEDYAVNRNCQPILIKTLFLLLFLSILPFTVLYFYAEEIFSLVFGDEWSVAGTYARILIPVFFMQFITSPLTYVFHIAGKQEVDFYLHILMTILLTGCFIYGFHYQGGIESALHIFALGNGVIYLIYLLFSIRYSKERL